MNVEEHQDLAAAFQVSSIPVVYFIRDGQVVDRIVGVNPPTVYEERIVEYSKPGKETSEEDEMKMAA